MCLIFKLGASRFVFETMRLWRGNSKGFVSKILQLSVELCNGL